MMYFDTNSYVNTISLIPDPPPAYEEVVNAFEISLFDEVGGNDQRNRRSRRTSCDEDSELPTYEMSIRMNETHFWWYFDVL